MRPDHPVRIVSCDLNGTLTHQHTMMDMIRTAFPESPERYEKAKAAFSKQTAGELSMKAAFDIAGPITRGLRLRQAIDYVLSEIRFIDGFEPFIHGLQSHGIRFVINSTGYDVTIDAIRHLFGASLFDRNAICNRLVFAWRGDIENPISGAELDRLVRAYVNDRAGGSDYDNILAAGRVELGIQDESEKAAHIFALADNGGVRRHEIVHIGDTMGDSGGILNVARHGGAGIAFNYNSSLKAFLEKAMAEQHITGRIHFVHPKSETSDLRRIFDVIQTDAL